MTTNTFDLLKELVSKVKCKPGWLFDMVEEDGALRLVITVPDNNSYPPHQPFTVRHYHPVPITTYNEKTWRRWIFEQCMRTETHEIGEWLRWGEDRPFAPLHGPGEDPYVVHEFRPEVDARTTQNGSIRETDEDRERQYT